MLGAINADAEHPIATQIKLARVRQQYTYPADTRATLTHAFAFIRKQTTP
jgi:hypothetical protein